MKSCPAALLALALAVAASAEEVTLTKSVVLKADHAIVAVKAGTVVELVARDGKTLTIRYNKVTGTVPAASIEGVVAAAKPAEPAPAPANPTAPAAPAGQGGAQTNYGKAVQKAKENAAKHEKNLVDPANEVTKEN